MIKAVLFDFDGVLTLDETGSQSICNYISKITGIEINMFKNEYRKYNPDLLTGRLKHEDVWQKICDELPRQISIDILYESFINTPVNTEMVHLAQDVKNKNYKIGMVTDNKSDRIRSIISYHSWGAMFDGIVVSADVGSCKEHEAIFNQIFESLSVNPNECIFIDNKKENLVVPQKLGVRTIFFDYPKNDIKKLKRELLIAGVEV